MGIKLFTYDDSGAEKIYFFFCPGCDDTHPFHVPAWNWNGSLDKPTFTPSLLAYPSYKHGRCHSYVTDGQIQFLSDSEHWLAGHTVEIPDWKKDE